MILLNDTEKAFDKIQHSFMTQTLSKLGIEGDFLNLKNTTYKSPTANMIFNGKRLNDILTAEQSQDVNSHSPLLFNIVM